MAYLLALVVDELRRLRGRFYHPQEVGALAKERRSLLDVGFFQSRQQRFAELRRVRLLTGRTSRAESLCHSLTNTYV